MTIKELKQIIREEISMLPDINDGIFISPADQHEVIEMLENLYHVAYRKGIIKWKGNELLILDTKLYDAVFNDLIDNGYIEEGRTISRDTTYINEEVISALQIGMMLLAPTLVTGAALLSSNWFKKKLNMIQDIFSKNIKQKELDTLSLIIKRDYKDLVKKFRDHPSDKTAESLYNALSNDHKKTIDTIIK